MRIAIAGATGTVGRHVTQAARERPGQLIALTRQDGRASVLDLHVQTVAARTVAEVLLDACEADWQPRVPDVAGLPDDALLPGEGARIAGPTFAQWLDSDDAAEMPL